MAICRDSYTGRTYYCNSRWYDWGRWVALGVILVVFFLFFFCCACTSQRRRRKHGRTPYYGTGWTQRLPYGHGQAQYNPQYEQQQQQQYQAPPQYNSPNTGTNQNAGGYYGQNQGYFGGQQTDVEMQRPQNTYASAPGENVYAPPAGPPPGKR